MVVGLTASTAAQGAAARVKAVFGACSVALITPFGDGDGEPVDHAAFQAHVTRVASAIGPHGCVIVAGSTGEQHLLTLAERAALYATAVAATDRPVIAGVAALRTTEAVHLARAAATAGCSGVMLGLPPYLRATDEEVDAYVREVTEDLDDRIAVVLYDNPARNGGFGVGTTTVAALFEDGAIGGVKVVRLSAEDTEMAARGVAEVAPGIRTYTGSDAGFARDRLHSLDGDQGPATWSGLTSVLGNVSPELLARVASSTDRSAIARDLRRIESLESACLAGCSLPTGIKAALRIKGWSCGVPRKPLGVLPMGKGSAIQGALLEAADAATA